MEKMGWEWDERVWLFEKQIAPDTFVHFEWNVVVRFEVAANETSQHLARRVNKVLPYFLQQMETGLLHIENNITSK